MMQLDHGCLVVTLITPLALVSRAAPTLTSCQHKAVVVTFPSRGTNVGTQLLENTQHLKTVITFVKGLYVRG